MSVRVSLIISVFEQIEYTKRCLSSLERTLDGKVEYEVLIVDDASEDGSAEFLRSLKVPFQVFFNSERKGFAKNNNLAASKAKGEFLCLLNNDVFVQGDWLLPMIKVFEEKKDAGVIGNVQRLAESRKYDHMGVVFAPEGNPRHYGQGFYYRPFKGEIREWSAVTAACCVTKAEIFRELNGFDEIFLNGCEDVDLCLRMTNRGLHHYVVHDSVVDHVRCASPGRLTYNSQNEAIFFPDGQKKL